MATLPKCLVGILMRRIWWSARYVESLIDFPFVENILLKDIIPTNISLPDFSRVHRRLQGLVQRWPSEKWLGFDGWTQKAFWDLVKNHRRCVVSSLCQVKMWKITGFVIVVKKSTSWARTHNIKTRVYCSFLAIVILSAKGDRLLWSALKRNGQEGRGSFAGISSLYVSCKKMWLFMHVTHPQWCDDPCCYLIIPVLGSPRNNIKFEAAVHCYLSSYYSLA